MGSAGRIGGQVASMVCRGGGWWGLQGVQGSPREFCRIRGACREYLGGYRGSLPQPPEPWAIVSPPTSPPTQDEQPPSTPPANKAFLPSP